MKNKSKLLYIAIIASAISCEVYSNQEALIIFPINVPSIVDGTPFGINGHEIKKLIYIIREVEKIIFGLPDSISKSRKGKYLFRGATHCVNSLIECERTFATMTHVEQQEFKKLLLDVIENFIKISKPFIEQAHGVKAITLGFMKEWSEKHDREESFLLDWAKQKDGQEFVAFRREITSFERLQTFCEDLISFLSDLIHSCPRAWEQFLELQEKSRK